MRKYNVALIACALLALALCLVPTRAFAEESGIESQVELGEDVTAIELAEQEAEEIAVPEIVEVTDEEQAEEEQLDEEQLGEGQTSDSAPPVVVQTGETIPVATVVSNTGENIQGTSSAPKKVTGYWLEGALATHYVGDELNCGGLTWAISYEDGSVEYVPVDQDAVNGYNKHKAGMQMLCISQAHERGLFMASTIVMVKERPTSTPPVVWGESQFTEKVSISKKCFNAASGVCVQAEVRDQRLNGLWAYEQLAVGRDPQLEGRYHSDQAAIKRISCELPFARVNFDRGTNEQLIGGALCDKYIGADDMPRLYAYPISESAYELLAAAS